MTISFSQAFGGGSAAITGGWTQVYTSSASVTFSEAGTVCLSVIGAGGGGAANGGGVGAASGGNSGPWGRKKFAVAASDVLVVTLGAGGAKATGTSLPGAQGGTTTVTLNGATILTVEGGEGGVYVAGAGPAQPVVPAAAVTGADYSRPGVRAGAASASGAMTGGAAVDILSNGTGKSPNVTASGAGLGGSVGTDVGGASLAWLALTEVGFIATEPALASTTVAIPGRGGQNGTIKPGALAGGCANDAALASGGYGGGGGAATGSVAAGNGGQAYAFLTFTRE